MTPAAFVIEADRDSLADAIADQLLAELEDVQAAGNIASIVLTGGTVADVMHRALADKSPTSGVDWAAVEIWWGDERFVPDGDADRNDAQARRAFLDRVNANAGRVHPMPSRDGARNAEEAAESYTATLAEASADGVSPRFDVVMLGVGPDGHIASLFPGYPALGETERSAVAVLDSPKPPPARITMTLPTLNNARHVWLLVSGDEKAEAVERGVRGDPVESIPAAGVHGGESTTWFLDVAASSKLAR